jgi:hypothetical protein
MFTWRRMPMFLLHVLDECVRQFVGFAGSSQMRV